MDALFPPSTADDAFRPSLYKVRFFNMVDTTPDTIISSTTNTGCDMTIFITQAPTLRRLLPIQIKVVYNSVLFSQNRIEEMLEQLQQVIVASSVKPDIRVAELSLVTDRSLSTLPDPRASLGWDHFEVPPFRLV